jgi:hypothetical protein
MQPGPYRGRATGRNRYVQPFASKPFTEIQADYCAPNVTDVLPARGGPVIAAATVAGTASSLSERMTPGRLNFSGFEWEVYRVPPLPTI